jgi:hypothetical protein
MPDGCGLFLTSTQIEDPIGNPGNRANPSDLTNPGNCSHSGCPGGRQRKKMAGMIANVSFGLNRRSGDVTRPSARRSSAGASAESALL